MNPPASMRQGLVATQEVRHAKHPLDPITGAQGAARCPGRRVGLRRLGLQGTELARAQANTIRLRLLKIGAQIRITTRKVWVSMASSYPYQSLFQQAYQQLLS